MKIGIYTLDSQPPQASVIRLDGGARGAVEFAPTSAGLPGPLPTGLTFPTQGCWKVEARGQTGFASMRSMSARLMPALRADSSTE
jgi:hypothetical protein